MKKKLLLFLNFIVICSVNSSSIINRIHFNIFTPLKTINHHAFVEKVAYTTLKHGITFFLKHFINNNYKNSLNNGLNTIIDLGYGAWHKNAVNWRIANALEMASDNYWLHRDFERSNSDKKFVTGTKKKDILYKFLAKELAFESVMYVLKKVIKNRSICTRISGASIVGLEKLYCSIFNSKQLRD